MYDRENILTKTIFFMTLIALTGCGTSSQEPLPTLYVIPALTPEPSATIPVSTADPVTHVPPTATTQPTLTITPLPTTSSEDENVTGLVQVQALDRISMGYNTLTPYSPMAGIVFNVRDRRGNLIITAQTDDNGRFQLRLPPGDYSLGVTGHTLTSEFGMSQSFEVIAGEITQVTYTVTIPFT